MIEFFERQLETVITSEGNIHPDSFSIHEEDFRFFPSHLFKYRDCKNRYNFAMLEEEYLWADLPQNFCDPQDAFINFKLKGELPSIKKWLFQRLGEILYYHISPLGMQPHKRGQTLHSYIDAQARFLDSEGRYSAKRAKKIMVAETRKLNHIDQQKILKLYDRLESEDFEQEMRVKIQEFYSKVVNTFRESALICCLTKRKDNKKMWEEYADKYTGFVIEYDLSQALVHPAVAQTLARTFPVSYYKRMPSAPFLPFIEYAFYQKLYSQTVDILPAWKKLFKQLLIKKSEYSNEEEWRILSSEQKIVFPAISAIYMGYKISDNDEKRLLAICDQKQIPIYKQCFNPFTGEMEFALVTRPS